MGNLVQPLKFQEVEYRPIPDAPGYRAGSDGSVWTCWKFKGAGYGKKAMWYISDEWKKLKPYPRKEDGRVRYTIKTSSGKRRRAYGSHLVLEAFVGPCPKGMEACHRNGNCLDDSADNLRWGTSVSNKEDMLRHGTRRMGESHGMAKLTEEDVKEIRRIGFPLKQHALKYGVTETLVSLILKRRVWKHVI